MILLVIFYFGLQLSFMENCIFVRFGTFHIAIMHDTDKTYSMMYKIQKKTTSTINGKLFLVSACSYTRPITYACWGLSIDWIQALWYKDNLIMHISTFTLQARLATRPFYIFSDLGDNNQITIDPVLWQVYSSSYKAIIKIEIIIDPTLCQSKLQSLHPPMIFLVAYFILKRKLNKISWNGYIIV